MYVKLEGESEYIIIFKNGDRLFARSGFLVSWSVVQVLIRNAYASWKVNIRFHVKYDISLETKSGTKDKKRNDFTIFVSTGLKKISLKIL